MLAELTAAIERRDPYTRGHSVRVADLAVTLGEALGWVGARLDTLRLGGLLHDIGKLAVSAHVLAKPGPLSPDELAAIRAHPVTGAKLLEPIAAARPALSCVLFHHERWDGNGYPTGRGGDRALRRNAVRPDAVGAVRRAVGRRRARRRGGLEPCRHAVIREDREHSRRRAVRKDLRVDDEIDGGPPAVGWAGSAHQDVPSRRGPVQAK